MAKVSRDLGAGALGTVLHPRESLYATGALAAANAEVVIDCDGASSIALDVRGTYVGTLAVEGTVDGTNYTPIALRPLNQASVLYLITLASAATGTWTGRPGTFRRVRVRMTAYTSGAATCTLCTSTGMLDPTLQDGLTSQIGTATGASAAAVTLTLASPGTGLRHYLTYLMIGRYAAAVLTASATPIIVTTTNLPGSLAFTRPADAATLGTMDTYREDFSFPIAASAQATATTIVAPATTGVIWRITVGYYVAP